MTSARKSANARPARNGLVLPVLVTYVPIISTFLPTALMGPEIITK
ncbi:MAG: hypothetical protein P8M28_00355 [Alphaproteobacteria bacterium]|jgi:hypothetical protein|nr:hypothetical protein [Alphaproteobacteria bacterium]